MKKNNNETLIAEGQVSLDAEYNTLLLIVHDQYLAVFVIDGLVYETNDLEELEVSGKFTEIALYAPQGATFKLDNVKYWDLDGAGFP